MHGATAQSSRSRAEAAPGCCQRRGWRPRVARPAPGRARPRSHAARTTSPAPAAETTAQP